MKRLHGLRVGAMALVLGLVAAGAFTARTGLAGEDREEKLKKDRARVEAQGFWIYNDLAKGTA